MTQQTLPEAPAGDSERLVALLCYVSMVFLPYIYPVVVLLSRRRTHFQAYHAVQSLALGVVLSGFWICLILVTIGYFIAIPPFGILMTLALICFGPICWAGSVFTFIYYGYQAYQGEYARVPALHPLLESLNLLPRDPA